MKREIVDGLTNMLSAGFTFVAALSWNEAVKSLFLEGGPLYFIAAYGVWVYAMFITIIAVFIGIWIAKARRQIIGADDDMKKWLVRSQNN